MAKALHIDPTAPKVIRRWREETMKLSRLELSRKLGVAKTTVSNWELGQNEPNPKVYSHMAAMASGADREWFKAKAGLSDGIMAKLGTSLAAPRASVLIASAMKEPEPIDRDLLLYAIGAVQAKAATEGCRLAAETFADMVMILYDHSKRAGRADAFLLDRLFRLMATVPEKKAKG